MLTLGRVGEPVKPLLEARKSTYSDLKPAQRATASDISKWLQEGEISPSDISIREAYFALVAE